MASFTNLALSLSQLGTRYINQIWTVTREVRDPASAVVKTPADYSQLGEVFIMVMVIGFVLPMVTVGVAVSYTHLTLPTNREV